MKPEDGFELTAPAPRVRSRKAGLTAERQAELEEWFAKVFWPRYPRKDKKQEALRYWLKLNPDKDTVEAIVADIRARLRGNHRATNWNGVDMQYILLPGSYLNARAWEE